MTEAVLPLRQMWLLLIIWTQNSCFAPLQPIYVKWIPDFGGSTLVVLLHYSPSMLCGSPILGEVPLSCLYNTGTDVGYTPDSPKSGRRKGKGKRKRNVVGPFKWAWVITNPPIF